MNAEISPDLRDVRGATPRGYEGFRGTVAPLASQSEPWWPIPNRAPANAPNVIVVLVDDLGYSDIEPFGGEIPTPALNCLAETGYRFTNFRVTPLCAPSRAALLTGANPHRAGFGWVPHLDPGYPGLSMTLPQQLPTLAETFRASGYGTFMVGKWHLTPESKLHDGAEKSSWPLQRGFDRYFGSMEGFTTLFHPHRILRDNSPVTEEFADDDYLTDRLTDEALDMIDAHRAGNSSKPFFLYFAHHAVHGPVQAKPLDIERFKGAYNAGWDRMRQARFDRQQSMGIFGANVELAGHDTPGFDENTPWEELSPEQQELYARHMEVYAASVAAVDASLGKLIDHLKLIGEYENTIILFTSDNGGTSEGGVDGTRSYFSQFIHQLELPGDWVTDVPRPLDELGGPRVHGHYPKGWAHVSNTPFRSYKGSTWEGGIHSPLIVSWPAGLAKEEEDSGLRHNFAYITDIAPTITDLAGILRPQVINGEATLDVDGESIVPLLRDPNHDQERGQYVALMGQRAYFRGPWKLVMPGKDRGAAAGPPAWSLYDIVSDPTEQLDVAALHPDLVEELGEEWRQAAWSNTVFPVLDSQAAFATVPSTVLELSKPITLRPGKQILERYRSSRLIDKRSFTIEIEAEGSLDRGMLVAHGDQGGGYALWTEDGEIQLSYNAYGDMHRLGTILDPETRAVTVKFDALPDVKWGISVEVDGIRKAELEPVPMLVGLAPFTGISVGFDGGSPVDWELHERHGSFRYHGESFTVRYVPGGKAAYNAEIVLAVEEVSNRLKD